MQEVMLFDNRRLVYSDVDKDSSMPMTNDHEYQDLDLSERDIQPVFTGSVSRNQAMGLYNHDCKEFAERTSLNGAPQNVRKMVVVVCPFF